MDAATRRSEVGIRELKNGLSKYVDRVRAGEEVIVTDRGRPVARLSPIDASDDRLAEHEALRGYDAVHLGAALLVGATVFSSADTHLCGAAARRGLHIANPLEG